MDCSGLTQMVFDLHGIGIPRDSKDQRSFLEKRNGAIRDPLAVPAGGLLFFGKNPERASHVGISLGGGGFIHAQGRVRIQSLDPDNSQFHKDLAPLFQVGSKVVKTLV